MYSTFVLARCYRDSNGGEKKQWEKNVEEINKSMCHMTTSGPTEYNIIFLVSIHTGCSTKHI